MRKLLIRDLVVEYISDGYTVRAVDGLNVDAGQGQIVLLLGPSGSGKTTVLSCLAGILTPTSGSIEFGDLQVHELRGARLAEYRRSDVGIVFQAFNLIPSVNAIENVAAPLIAAGMRMRDAKRRALELLEQVDLLDRTHHKPGKLSGGQQQRVALARALAHDPPLLLADEPTANLDYVNAEAVVSLLRELRSAGRLILISTHDERLIPIADQVVQMVPEFHQAAAAPQQVGFHHGQTVFEQGSRGHLVYTVQQGQVEIIRVLADGTEQLLAIKHPGEYFGELGPLLGFPRSATARGRGEVILMSYGVRAFREQVLGEKTSPIG